MCSVVTRDAMKNAETTDRRSFVNITVEWLNIRFDGYDGKNLRVVEKFEDGFLKDFVNRGHYGRFLQFWIEYCPLLKKIGNKTFVFLLGSKETISLS